MDDGISYQKNDRVFLKLVSGVSFEGDVHAFLPNVRRISLKNIVKHPDHVTVKGLRHFNFGEIFEVKTFGSTDNKHLTSDPVEPVAASNNGINEHVIKISQTEFQEISKLQEGYRYIVNLDTNFFNAIQSLKKHSKIGICAKDTSYGRKKRASVLAVSTGEDIYIFDIDLMGDVGFDRGLREVLESPDIIKVVHDGRLLSDCLAHQHVTSINNIRDVEAEDIATCYQKHGIVRKHARTMNELVEKYLGLPSAVPDEVDPKLWRMRPLSQDLQRQVVSYVSYLFPVQEAIEKRYMQKLVDASNLYNDLIKNSDELVAISKGGNHTLKEEMCKILKFVPKAK